MSIEQNLADILAARYGKDVRQAIHDGIELGYNIASDAKTAAETAQDSASTSATAAANSASAAQTAANNASISAGLAEQYKDDAFHTTPAGYQDFVSDTNSSLDYLADTGVKNIWNTTTITKVQTIAGLTVTRNDDGSVTVGTGTVNSDNLEWGNTILASDGVLEPNEKYDLSFGVNLGDGSTGVYARIFKKDTSSSSWTGFATFSSGTKGTFTVPSSYYALLVQFKLNSGYVVSSPLTVYPMIRKHDLGDDSFQHWSRTNKELTERTNYATGEITASENWTITTQRLEKLCGIVCLYLEATKSSAISEWSWDNVGVIPEGFRPVGYFDGVAEDPASTSSPYIVYKISAAGNISVQGMPSSSKKVRIFATYIEDQ